jgi:Tfp pilus assembly protein FimT
MGALAVPKLTDWSARLAVARAAGEVSGFYQQARLAATFRSVPARITLTSDSLIAADLDHPDSVLIWQPGPARLGVSLSASRNVLRFYPNGFALGASNTTIVLRKGEVAETMTVSRLGRLRRWH